MDRKRTFEKGVWGSGSDKGLLLEGSTSRLKTQDSVSAYEETMKVAIHQRV
jgi:hypothetical protein